MDFLNKIVKTNSDISVKVLDIIHKLASVRKPVSDNDLILCSLSSDETLIVVNALEKLLDTSVTQSLEKEISFYIKIFVKFFLNLKKLKMDY